MINTALTRLDPFTMFDGILQSMRSPLAEQAQRNAGFVPAIDAHRDGDDLVLQADLPGVDPENDVAVELSGRTLTVSGERRSTTESSGLREVRYGSFSRTVTLPTEVDQEAISADYTNGVLKVTVPGAYAEEKPHRIQVSANSGDTTTVGAGQGEKPEIDG